jgi:hypothetical protein
VATLDVANIAPKSTPPASPNRIKVKIGGHAGKWRVRRDRHVHVVNGGAATAAARTPRLRLIEPTRLQMTGSELPL